jgi:hypothetical protein
VDEEQAANIRDVLRKNFPALPFDSPALQAFMYATLGGYQIE